MEKNEKSMKELKKEEKAREYQAKIDEKRRKEEEKIAKREAKEKRKYSFGTRLKRFFLTIIFVIILVIAGFFGVKYLLNEKRNEIDEKKNGEIFESAVSLYDGKNYDKALEKLERIDSKYSKYNDVKDKINETKKKISSEKLLNIDEKIKEMEEKKDYIGILEYINENLDDADFKKKADEYIDKYKDLLIKQIESKLEANDVKDAKELIQKVINILDDDSDLEKLAEKVDDYEPVDLGKIDAFQSSGDIVTSVESKAKVRNNLGDSFSSYIMMPKSYYGEEESFIVYKLDKKYNSFTGKVSIGFESRASTATGKFIKIYGDDKLLYTSQEIKGGVEPFDISVDISSVDKLKIVMTNGDDCTFFIGNPVVSK